MRYRYVVLGLLRRSVPSHGYTLMREFERRTGRSTNAGNFYRELGRLAAEGLVRAVDNPADADPRRTPYEITPAGEASFDEWLSEPARVVERHSDEVSLRVFFLAEAEQQAARTIVEGWEKELWLHGKTLERAKEAALRHGTGAGASFDPLALLLEREMKMNAVDLEFLAAFRVTFDAWLARRRDAATAKHAENGRGNRRPAKSESRPLRSTRPVKMVRPRPDGDRGDS